MSRGRPLRVVHFQRRPQLGWYSLERLFADIRAALPPDIEAEVHEARYETRGLWRRLYCAIDAALHQGDVNHVTGDVHFLTYFMARKRTLLTILDCVSLERLSGPKRWVFWFFWYWLPARRCREITVISASTKRELMRYLRIDPDRVHVIHCGISDSFHPAAGDPDSGPPRLLQIGTTPNKNLERVAQALRGTRCKLVIVGHLHDSQRAALEENEVEFEQMIGLSEEALLEQYRRATLVVFASTAEGFGLPIIEANAIGRPVVTSNRLSMPEVAGDAACLVDPYDASSIRAGILRVLEDDEYRRGLVAAGFRNVERFQPAVLAAQYAGLYARLAGRDPDRVRGGAANRPISSGPGSADETPMAGRRAGADRKSADTRRPL